MAEVVATPDCLDVIGLDSIPFQGYAGELRQGTVVRF